MKILFVCTGNICRSAMAEGLARKIAKENNLDMEIYSAGIFAMKGDHASYNSVAIMKEYDVDIVTHVATPIEEADVEDMDLILCATSSHKAQVIMRYPSVKGRAYTMKEFAGVDEDGKDLDIKDPWGYDMNTYRLCAAEISFCMDKIMERLKNNRE